MGTAKLHVILPNGEEDKEPLLTQIAGKSGFVPAGRGSDGYSTSHALAGNDENSDQLMADLRAGGFLIAEDHDLRK
jgi:hypothetical protein